MDLLHLDRFYSVFPFLIYRILSSVFIKLLNMLFFSHMLTFVFSFSFFFLQIITTPTKAYQLRSRLVPKLSPESGSFGSVHTQNCSELDNDILSEPIPPEMSEQAFEALSEELIMVQVMLYFRREQSLKMDTPLSILLTPYDL